MKDKKLGKPSPDIRGDSAKQPGIKSLFATKDTVAKGADTSSTATNGPFARLLQQGPIPGVFYVAATDQAEIESYLADSTIRSALPPGKVVKWGVDSVVAGNRALRMLYVLDAKPIITGEYLTDAKPNSVPIEGTIVEFQFNNEGGRKFKNETAKHIKDYMAIVLDERVMSAPIIQSAIGSRGQITMGGKDLAGGAGPRARAPRRCAPGAAQGRRDSQHRREPRPGLDQQGHHAPARSPWCSWC